MIARHLYAVVFLFMVAAARADEGMWLLNQPPRDLLKKKYDFDLTDQALQKLYGTDDLAIELTAGK